MFHGNKMVLDLFQECSEKNGAVDEENLFEYGSVQVCLLHFEPEKGKCQEIYLGVAYFGVAYNQRFMR